MIKSKILITGCAGFIGFYVSRYFCNKGFNVIGIDNLNSYYSQDLKKTRLNILKNSSNFEFIKNDILDSHNLEEIFNNNKITFVLHFAAQAGVRYSLENPKLYIDTNIVGFLNILQQCKKYSINLFFASSSSVYGNSKNSIFRENQITDNQASIYGITKKTNELMAANYFSSYQVNSIGLRFFTVYGPLGRPDMAYFKFTDRILNDKYINVYNNGMHNRSFTYIDDVVESIFLLYEKFSDASDFNHILNIGSSKSISLKKFIKTIEITLNKKAIIKYLPKQEGDVQNTAADCDKLNNLIDFVPKINIEEGISNFVKWYIEYYKK